MEPEKIARINELARLRKERELTVAELAERDALRAQYPDGSLAPLQKKSDRPQ